MEPPRAFRRSRSKTQPPSPERTRDPVLVPAADTDGCQLRWVRGAPAPRFPWPHGDARQGAELTAPGLVPVAAWSRARRKTLLRSTAAATPEGHRDSPGPSSPNTASPNGRENQPVPSLGARSTGGLPGTGFGAAPGPCWAQSSAPAAIHPSGSQPHRGLGEAVAEGGEDEDKDLACSAPELSWQTRPAIPHSGDTCIFQRISL